MGESHCFRILLIPLILLGVSCDSASGPRSQLSEDEIIAIASKRALAEGFNPTEMDVVYDADNTMWKELERSGHISDPDTARALHSLKNRSYQAVRYMPKKLMLGGALWVFVDKYNGEVIALYGEE